VTDELVRYEPERQIEVSKPTGFMAGFAAAAALDDETFERNLAMLKKGQERVRRIQEALMTEGVDYGTVGDTKKPTLLKPGAEKLCLAYGLVARITVELIRGDGFEQPALRYDATCFLHVGSWDGSIVAVGYGSSSSWERRYRYSRPGAVCPDCGKPGLIKTRRNVYWHPFDAKPDGGCNANFSIDDPRVVAGVRVENADPWDNQNTLLKMSEKRSMVDAVLRATGTSGLFSQDLEDFTTTEPRPSGLAHGHDLMDPTDWSHAGFLAKAENEFAKEHISATAKELFPGARSVKALDDDQRKALFATLLTEAQAADEAADVDGGDASGYGS
jgi:hypothetical protein